MVVDVWPDVDAKMPVFDVATCRELAARLHNMGPEELEKFIAALNLPKCCCMIKFMVVATGVHLRWLPKFISWANNQGCDVLFYWRPASILSPPQYEEWMTGCKKGQQISKEQKKEIEDFMRAYPGICSLYSSFSLVLKFAQASLLGNLASKRLSAS